MVEPLKDRIDERMVADLAERVVRVDPDADQRGITECAPELSGLELKDRINLIADALAQSLSGDRRRQLDSIVALSRSGLEGMTAWPLASFIERHALDEPEAALAAMPVVTEAFSCEFAVRPYLDRHFELAMAHVMAWTAASSEHPRRLASEGTRPRLPWGPRIRTLLEDPKRGLAVLERLRHDPSEYVRRSVSNHLNDVAKDHPVLVLDTVDRWAAEPETDMTMIRHALRSLIKAGDARAMQILGFVSVPRIEVLEFMVTPTGVSLGQSIELSACLRSQAAVDQKVVVDFVIHHVLANGKTAPKVFKWATPTIGPNTTLELRKRRLIATASTRRYHAGLHRIDLQVAGSTVATAGFDLLVGSE